MENGKLEISGGSVTAKADGTNEPDPAHAEVVDLNSIGIFCDSGKGNNQLDQAGDITIKNAIVSATGGTAEISGGISSKYHLKISGNATVSAEGGNAVDNRGAADSNNIPRSFGLGCEDAGSITIEDSTVIATGGNFRYGNTNTEIRKQAGRSCGIYCGSSKGDITFKDCFVVARAGTVGDSTVGDKYTPGPRFDIKDTSAAIQTVEDNTRCAVFNMNGNANETTILLNGMKVIAAVYDYIDNTETYRTKFGLRQDVGTTAIYDYTGSSFATRQVIGRSINLNTDLITYDNNIAATGVVIVPDGWSNIITTGQTYNEENKAPCVKDDGSVSSTAIVTTEPNAVTIHHTYQAGISIHTNGLTFAAVSLYEGPADTAGIKLDDSKVGETNHYGKVTFTGGGEVIAVGGMTNGSGKFSYGLKNPQADAIEATVNATGLTAYGSTKSIVSATKLVSTSAIQAYPTGSAADSKLVRIFPAYPLKVNNVQVTGQNKADVLGDGTVRFDPQTTTLTLEGATVNGIKTEAGSNFNLNLALKGTSTVNKDSDTNNGITVTNGDLTIQSDGTSTVTTDAAGGIGVSVSGSLTVKGSGSLTVIGKGTAKAVSKAPDLTGYAGNCAVTASGNDDGSDPVDYVEANIAGYKYLRIEYIAPSSGSYNPPTDVTLYNVPDYTIWLTGSGLLANDQLITDLMTSGSTYNVMLRLANNAAVFGVYNIHLGSGTTSTGSAMYLGFDLGASYAGQKFTLVHQKADGSYEYFYATANANGDLVFGPLYELSPFMLVRGTLMPQVSVPDTTLTSAPKTGDNATLLGWALLLAAVLGAGGMALKKKRI
ncbi:MAG: hypothetical protein PHO41_02910 [Eubacteriales bacterium]|nr:hypothetical protein [Eubacteriales bacterium]